MHHPQLKSVSVAAAAGRVLVYEQAHQRIELADPDGAIADLLALLAAGTRTVPQLAAALRAGGHPLCDADVADGITGLADLGLVREADDWDKLPAGVRARHESSLNFYDLFATPTLSAVTIHQRVAAGRVLLLGVGGAGSGVLQALVGAGVAHVRIVDVDVVEEKNLARQFCYGTPAIGERKVDAAAAWAAAYGPGTVVEAIHEQINDADRVRELARDVDVVVCAIDTPANAQQLVNAACMDLGVPFVTGGMQQSTLYYWSVEPHVSACRECLELHRADQLAGPEAVLAAPALLTASHVNRGIGPVVQILAGLMALETLRYLSRHDAPVAAATYQWIALAGAMSTGTDPWTFHADCPYCRTDSRAAAPAGAVMTSAR